MKKTNKDEKFYSTNYLTKNPKSGNLTPILNS